MMDAHVGINREASDIIQSDNLRVFNLRLRVL